MLLSGGLCSSKLAVIEVKTSCTTQQLDLMADYTINIFFPLLSWLIHQSNFTNYRKRNESESGASLWIFHNPTTTILCAKCFYLKWFSHYQHSYISLPFYSGAAVFAVVKHSRKKHIIKSDKNKLFTMRYAHWDDECIFVLSQFSSFYEKFKIKSKLTPIELIWMLCSLLALLSFLSMLSRVRIIGQTFWYMTFLSRKPFSIR